LLQSAAWQVIADKSDDLSQASIARERVIALSRAADDSTAFGSEFGQLADRDFLLGFGLWRYALVLTERGEFAQAASLAQESLSIFQSRGNVYEQTGGLGVLGYLAMLQGELGQAHKLLTQALTYATIDKTLWMICYWQPFLSLTTLYGGATAEARRLLLESRAYTIELRRKHLLPRISIYLAETSLWEGLTEEAEGWLAECVGYRVDPPGLGSSLVNCFFVAARLAVVRQHYQQAAMLFGLAEERRHRTHYTLVAPVRAQVDGALATVQAALGPVNFAAAFAAGREMGLEEVFATIHRNIRER
jgi:tetratricopeptide (TPR) repeat protein